MIIIEGPDNSGKSTLANELSKRLNISLHHSGGAPRNAEEILQRFHNIVEKLKHQQPMIFDRVPLISDMVYGLPLRGGSPFQAEWSLHRQKLIDVLDFPIIYCRAPLYKISQLEGRDQSHKLAYKSAEHVEALLKNIPQVINNYDRTMAFYPHITYDYTKQGSSITIDQLVDGIREVIPDFISNQPHPMKEA